MICKTRLRSWASAISSIFFAKIRFAIFSFCDTSDLLSNVHRLWPTLWQLQNKILHLRTCACLRIHICTESLYTLAVSIETQHWILDHRTSARTWNRYYFFSSFNTNLRQRVWAGFMQTSEWGGDDRWKELGVDERFEAVYSTAACLPGHVG